MEPHELAVIFVRRLNEAMTWRQMLSVVASNRKGDPNICASHDYCDANQVMLDAIKELNATLDFSDTRQCAWMSEAWRIARLCEFDESRVNALCTQLNALDRHGETGLQIYQDLASACAWVSGFWVESHGDLTALNRN